jgi:hypothetical protein
VTLSEYVQAAINEPITGRRTLLEEEINYNVRETLFWEIVNG